MLSNEKLAARLKNLSIISAFLFIVIIVRLGDLQILHHEHYARLAKNQYIEKVKLAGDRGTIYDRLGVGLAVSRDIFSFYAQPPRIEEPVKTSRALSKVLGKSASWLEKKCASERDFEWLARRVSLEKKRLICDMDLKGISCRVEKGRYYPRGSMLAQVMGFCGLDNIGRWGLEESLQEYLKGTEGWVYMVRDACGKRYVDLSLPKQPPVRGCDVILTIDARLQEIVEMILERTVRDTRAKGGSVVVVDPLTGDVLAMASFPTIDLYEIWPPVDEGVYKPLKNRATMDTFEPGSTFKLISMAALLENGKVDPEELVFCENGSYHVGRRKIEDVHPHRWLTVKDVFAKSSNIGMSKLIVRLSAEDLHKTIKDFGIGSPTGVEFICEEKGLLNQPGGEGWSGYTMQSLSYGQEVSVTALQMAMAYCAVANGGELLVPHVVKEIRGPNGKRVWSSRRQVLWNSITGETALVLKDFLREVVISGTGISAGIGMIPIAGKTGTAQKAEPGRGYVDGRYVSSFAGFFPSDSPRVVIHVVIDEPEEKHYGSEVAAPAFREIAESILLTCPDVIGPATLAGMEGINIVESQAGEESLEPERQLPPDGHGTTLFVLPAGSGSRRRPASGQEVVVMPDLLGLSLRDAMRVVKDRGIGVSISGSGFVVKQKPGAGMIIPRGEECYLRCSSIGEG